MNKLLKIVPVAFVLAIVACSDAPNAETSSKLFRPEDQKQFIELLTVRGIPHRVTEDGQVFYPVSQREEVHAIFLTVIGAPNPEVKGIAVPANVAAEVAAKLTAARIPFEIAYQEDSTQFTWPSRFNKESHSIILEVLDQHGT